MQLKSSITKILVPPLEKCGFSFLVLGASDYCLQNSDQSRYIRIDTERYPPKRLRFAFQMSGRCSFRLKLNDFDPQFCAAANMHYQTNEELAHYLEAVQSAIITTILPYLDAMEENFVEYQDAFSQRLSCDTSVRAERCMEKWNLSLTPDSSTPRQLDKIMDSMKSEPWSRKREFFENEEEIIDLSACYGIWRSLKAGVPASWKWREVTKGCPEFVIASDCYNPLMRVLDAWNFGTEVASYALQGYHSRVEMQ